MPRSLLRYLLVALSFCFVSAPGTTRAATHTWSGAAGGANTRWSHAANWSSGGVPVAGESNLVLIFPPDTPFFQNTPDIPGLSVSQIQVTAGGTWNTHQFLDGGVSVTLNGAPGDNFIVTGDGGVGWAAPLVLTGVNWFNASLPLEIKSSITGTGAVTKKGTGTLNFTTSSSPNTYPGTTRVEGGVLILSKPNSAAAFGGDLALITGGICYVKSSNQIPNSAAISMQNGQLLISNDTSDPGSVEVIGNVTMTGGFPKIRVLNQSQLTITGSVTVDQSEALINQVGDDAKILLSTGNHTLSVAGGGSLELYGNIADATGAAGIIKTGSGELRLTTATSFTGPCTVSAGVLQVGHDQALGGAGATIIQPGATMELGMESRGGVQLPATEAIQLSGTLACPVSSTAAGNISLSGSPVISPNADQTLTLSGVLSGTASSLSVAGSGSLLLSGSSGNSFSGQTDLASPDCTLLLHKTAGNAINGPVSFSSPALLKLLASHQILDTASVQMPGGGTVDLNGFSDAIGQLSGIPATPPLIRLGSGTLTATNTSDAQFGAASNSVRMEGTGAGKFRKLGNGTLTFHHQHVPGADLPVLSLEAGTLYLQGNWLGSIEARGGLLRGRATTGVIRGMGGGVCLCDFTTAGFTGTSPGIIRADLDGNTPGFSYDRMITNGSVNLTGQTLQANVFITPLTGGHYTLIRNNSGSPVTGTFTGLPEGTVFNISGQPFRITYAGGDTGRDVVLIYQGIGASLPVIISLQRQANGSVLLGIKGDPNQTITVQHSISLQSWNLIGVATTDAAGLATFTHNAAPALHRFYRLAVD